MHYCKKKCRQPQVAKQPQPKKVKNDIMEVDLHAHELLDTTAGDEQQRDIELSIGRFS